MYIHCYDIFCLLLKGLPEKVKKPLLDFFHEKKIQANMRYIKKNKLKVIENLKNDSKNRKLNVVFYVYEDAKWKCQSLFDILTCDENFLPMVFVVKNCAKKDNFNFQSEDDIRKVYKFFKKKNMNVFYAYDFKKKKNIPFEKMNPKPDIIIYQHPWYVDRCQGPVVCSKFALTYYMPYFIPTSVSPVEYHLRFHSYVENFCVLDEKTKKYYSLKMSNKGENIKVVGHTMLDFYYLNKNQTYENDNTVIYAPHWTVDNKNLAWGTFLWSRDVVLDFAKNHPEFNWVFKPHPCLYNYLLNQKILSKADVDNYWSEWGRIGRIENGGDYINLFMSSRAIISDCGSFLTEYLFSKKPFIRLKSKNPYELNPFVDEIVKCYYNVSDKHELIDTLNRVIVNNDDYFKEKRLELIKKSNLDNNFAAKCVLDDIKKTVEMV